MKKARMMVSGLMYEDTFGTHGGSIFRAKGAFSSLEIKLMSAPAKEEGGRRQPEQNKTDMVGRL